MYILCLSRKEEEDEKCGFLNKLTVVTTRARVRARARARARVCARVRARACARVSSHVCALSRMRVRTCALVVRGKTLDPGRDLPYVIRPIPLP
jgi:hypothetical protein